MDGWNIWVIFGILTVVLIFVNKAELCALTANWLKNTYLENLPINQRRCETSGKVFSVY